MQSSKSTGSKKITREWGNRSRKEEARRRKRTERLQAIRASQEGR